MIKIVLHCKAGNQLFQYAAGRYLAYKHNTALFIDIARYGGYKRVYALPYFHTVGKTINPIPALIYKRITGNPLWKLYRGPIFLEKDHRFHPAVHSLPRNCTLFGYFQSERYFKPISSIIRQEISFRPTPLDDETRSLRRTIISSNAVSIHVRRGDYLKFARYNVCTMSYYKNAMATMRQRLTDPRFFVFSDDVAWCVQNFEKSDGALVFVDLKQSRDDPLIDMRLMSECKHHIIANSSFSWWGAWLNRNSEKIVLCPDIWFRGENVPIEEKLCEGWETVGFS